MPIARYDPVYFDTVVPTTCQCCEKCWLVVLGPRRGSCVHGGPYKGWLTLIEPSGRAP